MNKYLAYLIVAITVIVIVVSFGYGWRHILIGLLIAFLVVREVLGGRDGGGD